MKVNGGDLKTLLSNKDSGNRLWYSQKILQPPPQKKKKKTEAK